MSESDESGQYRCLVKHFFRRFFDLEAITSAQINSIEKNVLTFQILALIILPGVLKSLFLSGKYAYYMYRPVVERDAATLTDKCFFLSLSMIILGFTTVYEWDMLFPDQKDYLILTPFPVATRTIFSAKVAAPAAFLLVFTVAAANLEAWLLGGLYRLLGFYILAAVLLLMLVRHNRRSDGAIIRFEEESEEAPIYLNLRS